MIVFQSEVKIEIYWWFTCGSTIRFAFQKSNRPSAWLLLEKRETNLIVNRQNSQPPCLVVLINWKSQQPATALGCCSSKPKVVKIKISGLAPRYFRLQQRPWYSFCSRDNRPRVWLLQVASNIKRCYNSINRNSRPQPGCFWFTELLTKPHKTSGVRQNDSQQVAGTTGWIKFYTINHRRRQIKWLSKYQKRFAAIESASKNISNWGPEGANCQPIRQNKITNCHNPNCTGCIVHVRVAI